MKNSTAVRNLAAACSFYGWCAPQPPSGESGGRPVRPVVGYDTSATPGLTRNQAVAPAMGETGDGTTGWEE